MFRSLRNRLIFSHILPSLVIIPLLGVAMVYLLETRILLPMIYSNLSVARAVPEIWQNTTSAQIFAQSADPYLSGRLTLTDPYGHVLASTDPYESELTGEIVDLPDLATARQGDIVGVEGPSLHLVFRVHPGQPLPDDTVFLHDGRPCPFPIRIPSARGRRRPTAHLN